MLYSSLHGDLVLTKCPLRDVPVHVQPLHEVFVLLEGEDGSSEATQDGSLGTKADVEVSWIAYCFGIAPVVSCAGVVKLAQCAGSVTNHSAGQSQSLSAQ